MCHFYLFTVMALARSWLQRDTRGPEMTYSAEKSGREWKVLSEKRAFTL